VQTRIVRDADEQYRFQLTEAVASNGDEIDTDDLKPDIGATRKVGAVRIMSGVSGQVC
jgi:hypothetical protein